MTSLSDLLGRPIAFQRSLIKATDPESVLGALLLSQAIYWQERCKSEDGWWWKTQPAWEEETGMGRREFETARRACAGSGVLDYEVRGVPARGFYRLNEAKVLSILGISLQTSLAESAKLDCLIPPNKVGAFRQTTSTETTTENTSNNKKSQFAQPSLEEMQVYAQSISLSKEECEKAYWYYESKGWVIGKSPMKSWRAALQTWLRNSKAWAPSERNGFYKPKSTKPAGSLLDI